MVGALGMQLQDGIGRSTQLGDMAAFFIGIAVLILLGAVNSQGRWLYAAAMFMGSAAVFRILAALVAGATMATSFIVAEVILTAWLCTSGWLLNRNIY